ncbi:MAG: hypothetical protein ACRYG4_17180 [Janthinobacterium lividum]
MRKFVRSIKARGGSGKLYNVLEYVDQIDVTSKDSAGPEFLDGMRSLLLSDGRHVNFVTEDEFQIVGGEAIRKVD